MAAVTALSACSPAICRKWVDHDVAAIIADKERAIFGEKTDFSIETRYSERKPQSIKPEEILADRTTDGKCVIPLQEALRVAVVNSRSYQSRKEQLYLTALTLTGERHEFSPQFFANTLASTHREITRTGAKDRSGHLTSTAGFEQALLTGGAISAKIANDLVRYFTGDPRRSAASLVSLDLMQPLLRGAGPNAATERLTQADRNVLYDVRSFSRFQNTFAVDIVADYWRILQLEDVVQNEALNVKRLTQNRERAEALSRDRLPLFQVDQARQNELTAKNRYILAVEQHKKSLDEFKITLGIPVGTELSLDPKALDELRSAGPLKVPFSERRAFEIGIDHRLDLLNEIDRFEDSKRKIKVAANALRPDLNLIGNMSLPSEDKINYADFNLEKFRGEVGVELKLPLDRLRERNDYRATLVTFESQLRSLSLALDQLRKEVRDDFRDLERARQSYEIQTEALNLAERRVESAGLLLQAGRAQMRDVLDAQSSQVSAQNGITEALINYHLARLELLNDLGVLATSEEGFWIKPQALPN